MEFPDGNIHKKESEKMQDLFLHSPPNSFEASLELAENNRFSVRCFLTPNTGEHGNADEYLVLSKNKLLLASVLDGISGNNHSLVSDSALVAHVAHERLAQEIQALSTQTPKDVAQILKEALLDIDFEGLLGGINGSVLILDSESKSYALISVGNDDSKLLSGENENELQDIKPDVLPKNMFVPSQKRTKSSVQVTEGRFPYEHGILLVGSDGVSQSDIWRACTIDETLAPGKDDKSIVVISF